MRVSLAGVGPTSACNGCDQLRKSGVIFNHWPVRWCHTADAQTVGAHLEANMLDSIKAVIASIHNHPDRVCFEAGYDCEMNGANTKNCHFSLFSTREHTRAWEEGRQAACKEKAAQFNK